jgi:hypothetical protein
MQITYLTVTTRKMAQSITEIAPANTAAATRRVSCWQSRQPENELEKHRGYAPRTSIGSGIVSANTVEIAYSGLVPASE